MFPVSRLLSHSSFPRPPIARLLSHISCLMFSVSCLTSPVSLLMSQASYCKSPVSHLLSHVFCLMSPVSCLLCHVCCLKATVTYPVPCLMSPISSAGCTTFFRSCNRDVHHLSNHCATTGMFFPLKFSCHPISGSAAQHLLILGPPSHTCSQLKNCIADWIF